MLFYITSGASQAVPESACVEANRTACVELYCSSVLNLHAAYIAHRDSWCRHPSMVVVAPIERTLLPPASPTLFSFSCPPVFILLNPRDRLPH
jgi:hypothetical protein